MSKSKSKFQFGDYVIPSKYGVEWGVFSQKQRDELRGLVCWNEETDVVVHIQGRKTSAIYHTDFWEKH